MSVPGRSVVESLSANRTFLPFLRVAHAGRGNLLHVVVQLELKCEKKTESQILIIANLTARYDSALLS